ncbi:MAG: phage holin family protein [Sedimenticola thiotaurini]|uniref:Phage holin family protein n=1 Tax=Sedimenticola thiotaurini TaxID=1543721 RepID=A0A558CWP3_9GAMM|nr:MAG: phage holin family protein [Sedimenticola thiotaurini]
MTNQTNSAGKGLFESLSALSATLLGMLYTRLDLLSIDLEEERAHLILQLVLVLTALFFMGIGVVLIALLLVMVYWETHRILVLASLAGIFLLAGLVAGGFALHKVRTKPKLFAASLSELHKDRQQLVPPV